MELSNTILVEESESELHSRDTVLDYLRRIPQHVLSQNMAIFKQQRLKLPGADIDLSSAVKRMKESTCLWGGGWTTSEYKSAVSVMLEQVRKRPPRNVATVIYTKDNDCVDELIMLQEASPKQRVALLNLASRAHVCGLWDNPYLGTQEETIERRSALYRHALDPQFNDKLAQDSIAVRGTTPPQHIPAFGCVTTEGVPIIRRRNWCLTTDVKYIDVIACGAVDLRLVQMFRWKEREQYMGSSLPLLGELDLPLFIKHTKRKMRMVLMAALLTDHSQLVLGALGCGAYGNPPDVIARCWREVLESELFKNQFDKVVFAVLGPVNAEFFKEFGSEPTE